MAPEYKIVVLGEGAVGKTSLIVQFVQGKFTDERKKTLNASFMAKKVKIGAKSCTLNIWDTAGQEMFDAIAGMYYRDADVYDITIKESFNRVNYWLSQLKEFAPPNVTIQIVGNKIDKESERKLEKEKVIDFCKKNNCFYEETSAKEDLGVAQMFRNIASQILGAKGDGNTGIGNKKKNLQGLDLDEEIGGKKKGGKGKKGKKCC